MRSAPVVRCGNGGGAATAEVAVGAADERQVRGGVGRDAPLELAVGQEREVADRGQTLRAREEVAEGCGEPSGASQASAPSRRQLIDCVSGQAGSSTPGGLNTQARAALDVTTIVRIATRKRFMIFSWRLGPQEGAGYANPGTFLGPQMTTGDPRWASNPRKS